MISIQIKSFGPIRNISINLKTINIFIGPHSGGKSTVAKLATIFKSGQFNTIGHPFGLFKKLLGNYNIEYTIGNDTYIKYEDQDFLYEISNGNFSINRKDSEGIRLNPIYVPAERVFFSTWIPPGSICASHFGMIGSSPLLVMTVSYSMWSSRSYFNECIETRFFRRGSVQSDIG